MDLGILYSGMELGGRQGKRYIGLYDLEEEEMEGPKWMGGKGNPGSQFS